MGSGCSGMALEWKSKYNFVLRKGVIRNAKNYRKENHHLNFHQYMHDVGNSNQRSIIGYGWFHPEMFMMTKSLLCLIKSTGL